MKFNFLFSMKQKAVANRVSLYSSLLALGVITSCGTQQNAHAQSVVPVSNVSSEVNSLLQMTWGTKGFLSLKYNDREYLLNSLVQVDKATLRNSSGIVPFSNKSTPVYDSNSRAITSLYNWGKVVYKYSIVEDKLQIVATVTNTSDSTSIENIVLNALNLRLSSDTKIISLSSKNIDDLAFSSADMTTSVLSLYTTAVNPTMNVCFSAPYGTTKDSYGVKISASARRASDFINADASIIGPGESQTFDVWLGFSPAGTMSSSLLLPLYQQRAPSVPAQLNWRDRRPIGSIFLANSNTRYATNPRGWFNDSKANVFTADGLAAYRKKMLAVADTSVKNLKAVNAQGMIFWDLEGEEMPHPTSYIGDPRMLPALAPEMDNIADEFFARFRDAGLKTGVCLRPSRIRSSSTGLKWQHTHMAFDPIEELSQKIDYARNRWGCRIFYVDSNATYAYDSNGKVTSWIMRADMFSALQARHPDVLLIPEQETYDYWSATAPYGELDMGNFGTPEHVRWSYPDAFSVINIADGAPNQKHAKLVEAVKNGDVLLFRCWFNDGTHDEVKSIYADSGRPAEPDTNVGTPTSQLEGGNLTSASTASSSNSA